jgi:hypothetical protein
MEELGRVRADVAESLDGDARLIRLVSEAAEEFEREQADAAAGGSRPGMP